MHGLRRGSDSAQDYGAAALAARSCPAAALAAGFCPAARVRGTALACKTYECSAAATQVPGAYPASRAPADSAPSNSAFVPIGSATGRAGSVQRMSVLFREDYGHGKEV